jgi:type IV secretory pathway VirD2 relaxase
VQARRGSGVASLKRHFSYLERSGVSESGGKPSFFSGEESGLSRKDIPLEECAKDPHHFRFIISPERGAELPLEDYTRRVMEQVEEELQLKL